MKKILFSALICAIVFGGFAAVVRADHSWGSYHWSRTSNPFTLQIGDNVTGVWDTHLAITASDWSLSNVLDTVIKPGKSNRNCKATSGRIEACNAKYGYNGWLGIAQIWVSGDHITKGTVKVNDTYFNQTPYNSDAWRNLVLCQEVGHTLGLGHTDEDFYNEPGGTCMDYSIDPAPNQHPNQHDYDMLEEIYAHLDSTNTYLLGGSVGGGGSGNSTSRSSVEQARRDAIDLNDPREWGDVVRRDARGNRSLLVRDLGNGEKVFTHVIWIEGFGE